jgi:protein dithiol:quinone oxidoreductase
MKRSQYLSISLLSLGLVVAAVVLQQVGYKDVAFLPCPLCIFQRIAYLGIAVACFIAATPLPLRKLFHFLAMIASAIGAAIAGKQVWLLYHPEVSCGIDPLEIWINQFQLAKGLPWLFKADGLCSAQLPPIFGLQLPQWSLFWFCAILLTLVLSICKKSK